MPPTRNDFLCPVTSLCACALNHISGCGIHAPFSNTLQTRSKLDFICALFSFLSLICVEIILDTHFKNLYDQTCYANCWGWSETTDTVEISAGDEAEIKIKRKIRKQSTGTIGFFFLLWGSVRIYFCATAQRLENIL